MKRGWKLVPFSFVVYHSIVKNNLRLTRDTQQQSYIFIRVEKVLSPTFKEGGCNLLERSGALHLAEVRILLHRKCACLSDVREQDGRRTMIFWQMKASLIACVALKLPGKTWPAPISICSLLSFELCGPLLLLFHDNLQTVLSSFKAIYNNNNNNNRGPLVVVFSQLRNEFESKG